VVLTELPPGLIEDLPGEDQKAISNIVGASVLLVGYDDDGRAELEFTDSNGIIHFLYVNPNVIRGAK
jgi:hypothetical protein